MKLLYCKNCGDIFNLWFETRRCKCAKSEGRYINTVDAEYSGPCIPVGILNDSLSDALKNQPFNGKGKEFTAFVIPENCLTMTKVEKCRKN